MQFKTLENTSIANLVHAFNEAFSDYLIPVNLTKEQMLNKIIAEGIQREFSIGAFDGEKLIGFILHGIEMIDGEKIAYNAGTGVIPYMRGKKITAQLYDYSFSKLKKEGVKKINLEVLSENLVAKRISSAIGFEKKRTLNSYKGSITDFNIDNTVDIKQIYQPDWKLLQTFWNWSPSWQNSVLAVNKSWSLLDTIGAFKDDRLVGYVVHHTKLNRILQFAIDKNYRKAGYCKQLFQHYAQNKSKTVFLNNIDSGDVVTNSFLSASGLQLHLKQDEMQLTLS